MMSENLAAGNNACKTPGTKAAASGLGEWEPEPGSMALAQEDTYQKLLVIRPRIFPRNMSPAKSHVHDGSRIKRRGQPFLENVPRLQKIPDKNAFLATHRFLAAEKP
jgi:hypothetical protein